MPSWKIIWQWSIDNHIKQALCWRITTGFNCTMSSFTKRKKKKWNQWIHINRAFYIKGTSGSQSVIASKIMNAGINALLYLPVYRLSSRFVVACWVSRSMKKALCLLMTYPCEACTRQLFCLITVRFLFNTDLDPQFSRKERGKISSFSCTLLSVMQQWSFPQHQEKQILSFRK